jgi:endonuclease III
MPGLSRCSVASNSQSPLFAENSSLLKNDRFNGILSSFQIMPIPENDASKILIIMGKELHSQPRNKVPFSGNPDADSLLNDIEKTPHFFVLGCIMDRQVIAPRAWILPYRISQIIKSTDFCDFLTLDLSKTEKIFIENSLHRMPSLMARCFYDAIQRIHSDYSGDASNIWKMGNPSSRDVVQRFLQFNGVGQKISTMATNILVREFKVQLKDNSAIDISVDIQVERVFKRLGFVPKTASKDDIIFAARSLNPQYPGIFDSICWEIGGLYCRPTNPLCCDCVLSEHCPKIQ